MIGVGGREKRPSAALLRARRKLAAACAGVAGALEDAFFRKEVERVMQKPQDEVRIKELRPILMLVRPLKPCPKCLGQAEIEWREDGMAVRAGCPPCSFAVESLVAPETDMTKYAGSSTKPAASLETRQQSAQAEAIENWNLYADGAWDGKSTPGHIQTKVVPDWKAVFAKPESEKPHGAGRHRV